MDIKARINDALELVKQQDYVSAEKVYKELLEIQPDNPVILSFLGYLYLSMQRYIDSERIFEKANSLSESQSILAGLAVTKYILRKYEDAVPLYCDLIKTKPEYDYYEKLTTALSYLITAGKRNYAELAYRYGIDAVKKFPFKKEVLLNLSIACLYSGRFKESEKYCSEVLKQNPDFARGLSQAGFIRECLYCDESGAQELYKKAVQCGIGHCGYYDLGISYSKSGDYIEAENSFHKALELLPNNETIFLGLAYNFFRQRKFEQGYEYYIKQNDSSDVRTLTNVWDGKVHKDKTVFVYPDLSYGDHIMFMRYVPFLKNFFGGVKVFVYPQLKKLFEKKFDVEFVDCISDYDYSVALSKLPYYLKMDFSNIPYSQGYLDVVPADIKSDRLKIGLCWEAGNSDLRSTIHRSMNVKELLPLFDKGFDIYSFQVNPSSKEYQNFEITDLGKGFKDFYDTAQALKCMDVVVSVDTSVANLAGAMGVKTFMLIPYYPDWRWFDNDKTTEWYDSVRIFKQSLKNSWEKEVNDILAELTEMKEKC